MRPTLRHKFRNLLHTAVLILGMAGVAWLCVVSVWGTGAALWAVVGTGLALLFAPAVPGELVLALYRARPIHPQAFPDGYAIVAWLASALLRIERSTGRFWEEILLPGRRIPEPSLLHTHPRIEERVARLREMASPQPSPHLGGTPHLWATPNPWAAPPKQAEPGAVVQIAGFPVVLGRPRWRRTGVWY